MNKTIIVSNRLPLKVQIKDHQLKIKTSVGGLATGLLPIHQKNKGIWIGWAGMVEEDIPCDHLKDEMIEAAIQHRCIPVSLNRRELKDFYQGFSNSTIWPLFHYFTEFSEYNDSFWKTYQEVNQRFADQVLDFAEEGDTVWVHDYQLMLVPQLIREKKKNITIGFFLHIPFPSYEVFRLLPYRREIIEGLLGADLIGFHTAEYTQHFINSARNLTDSSFEKGYIQHRERSVKAGTFPLGIDVKKFEAAAQQRFHKTISKSTVFHKKLVQHKQDVQKVKLILSIDRLDYTKGIANRIRALDYFLQQYPQYIGKVKLLMLAVPSRTQVPQYQLLKKEIDELVGYVNGKYGNVSWTPIWYFYRAMPFSQLIDLYTSCEIALITPIRDGMNLVAKEYIAARVDKKGVLILSEMAGAANEMKEALLVNPNSFKEIAEALQIALTMPAREQIKRNTKLQQRLKKYNVSQWAHGFLKTLLEAGTKNQKTDQPKKNTKELKKGHAFSH